MKRLFMWGVGVFFLNTALAQPQQISPANLSQMKLKVAAEVEAKKKAIRNDRSQKDDRSDVSIDFQMDTMKIQQFLKRRIAIDYSTSGMVEATFDAEKEYDQLLNKYYQQLLKRLKAKDKALLIGTQKNWIKYRDSERNLQDLLTEDDYSGGGTIQRIIRASGYLEITKKRVMELNGYLEQVI